MEDRRKISSTRELINILDSAEINAKEVQAVKDEVGYDDSIYPDSEGNTTTLTQFIHNNIESYKKRAKDAEAELKEVTQEYVKSQCSRTHVLIERQVIKDIAGYCSDAYDTVDGVEYDADECVNYAEGMSRSVSDAKDSMTSLQSDLEQIAEQDMPEEAMEASRPPAKKAPAKKSGDSNE